jgi:hypothetical protein
MQEWLKMERDVLKYGLCLGSSDLIGWTIREITPDMVEKKVAVFTAIQVIRIISFKAL